MFNWGGLVRANFGRGRCIYKTLSKSTLSVQNIASQYRSNVCKIEKKFKWNRWSSKWNRWSSSSPSYGIEVVSNASDSKKLNTTPLYAKYLALSKARLSSLVVASALFAYYISPGSIDLYELVCLTAGTSLTAACANSINQYIEVDNDLLMDRTKNRVLPSKQLSLNHALAFGICTGTFGVVLLAIGINFFTAFLGFINILTYTLVYTPMKKLHYFNTYVGSIVGAIPPLMGWVAQTNSIDFYSFVLFAVLFLWQMTHFFSLSWPLRHDYDKGGYRMLSNVHPKKLPFHTLLWTASLLYIAPVMAYVNFTTWWLVLDSSPLTLYWITLSYKFYKDPSVANAMSCFKFSICWLPLFLTLVAFHVNCPD